MKFETPHLTLGCVAAFSRLGQAELRRLLSRCYTRTIARGEIVSGAGDEPLALHVVLSGRFARFDATGAFLGEIGPGGVIAEVEFFSRSPLAETIAAVRESTVLTLEWEEFVHLADRAPEYWRALCEALAVRGAAPLRLRPPPRFPKPQTLAIIGAGQRSVPAAIVAALTEAFDPLADSQVLTSRSFGQNMPGGITLDDPEVVHWLRAEQQGFELIIRTADPGLTDWTKAAIAEADEIILIAIDEGGGQPGACELNDLEREAFAVRGAQSCRLVIVHRGAGGIGSRRHGTRPWLEARPVRQHHHALEDSPADFARIARFVMGASTGYVAYGGGAFASAHLGVMQALEDAGVPVDCVGGTGGGAVAAALIASGVPIRDALALFPLPRNRATFAHHADAWFGGLDIEDLHLPFSALATDLKSGLAVLHESGPLMHALLANWPPSGLAHPYPAPGGALLADGSLIDAHPLWLLDGRHDGPTLLGRIAQPTQEKAAEEAASPVDRALKRLAGVRSGETGDAFEMADIMLRGLCLSRANGADERGDTIAPVLPAGLQGAQAEHHVLAFEAAYAYAKNQLERAPEERHVSGDHFPGSAP